ncbi:class IIb bacteriocin, lactobin A/cerein 7B family [Alteromonas pelagimontana]|uniref:Class IIb bacteriocin, lactobin A/cerein 7B family n=1 Tax=Alteromonas pelagimontana TaxID=1858656 RepID=A0A6M4MGS8_9ALTE|nr:class IIb bacteriocin, lactobin A/cerein 7B family [Alteromonas pelagimontana]QJR82401.1 class IIb bacteriocin, lactobin A/cerein 7B family [Alteromonas pelagimontana]
MQELTLQELETVNGGILPLILGIAAADMGLISAMYGAGYWR